MNIKLTLASAMALFLLAGCGGDDTAPTPTPKAFVAGDSLNDVGVFGARATVQSANVSAPYLVWPEIVANSYKLNKLCPAYNAALSTIVDCTGYAIGGAQINPVVLSRSQGLVVSATIMSDVTPMSIVKQIQDMGAGRTFGSQDLMMIDGGGNDVNALASAFFEGLNPLNPFATQALSAYKAVLKDLLPATSVDAVASNDTTALTNLGSAYMQQLAVMLANAIKSNLIAKGAARIVVLNIPDLSKTPALNALTAPVPATMGAWADAFNTKLVSELSAETSKVLVVDFKSILNGYVAAPSLAKVGLVSLSNARDRACGNKAISSCTDTFLDAGPPSPADWRTYLFADDLHATPFGNELMAQSVRSAIASRGWSF